MRHWLAVAVLVIDLWAITSILASPASRWARLRWISLIVFLPFLGALLWLASGTRAPRTLRQQD
ncbi:MAG: PLDc N-terminal domain-containing protein [bacterium]